jgi:hypothetical protein
MLKIFQTLLLLILFCTTRWSLTGCLVTRTKAWIYDIPPEEDPGNHTLPFHQEEDDVDRRTAEMELHRRLHGTDGAISMEQRRKETATEAVAVYQATIGNVSQTDSVVLHHARIDEILKWTKEHLDAYLASADVIIDQHDEPG